LFTLLLATASTVFAETEPNDTSGTADPLGICPPMRKWARC
jgi:hypothetical protein